MVFRKISPFHLFYFEITHVVDTLYPGVNFLLTYRERFSVEKRVTNVTSFFFFFFFLISQLKR